MLTVLIVVYLIASFLATGAVLALNGATGREWTKLALAPVMLPIIAHAFVRDRLNRLSKERSQ